jgi:multisubunit Na+/H+ antiporter MnhF subunit
MRGMSQQRVIWFAIVMSTVIYLVIALQLAPNAGGDFDASASRMPAPVLYAVALGVFLFAWFVAPRVIRAPNAQTRMIIHLSLFEAVAVFGLMAAFLAEDWRLYLPAWVLSVVGFIRELPRDSSRTAP